MFGQCSDAMIRILGQGWTNIVYTKMVKKTRILGQAK